MSNQSQKSVLIVSPQTFEWRASKRYYAEAFASLGFDVYFLEPLSFGYSLSIEITEVEAHPNIKRVALNVPLPDFIRFRLNRGPQRLLYKQIIKACLSKLTGQLPQFQLLLQFDNNLILPTTEPFSVGRRAFMIMDAMSPSGRSAWDTMSAEFDHVGAIAQDFLDKIQTTQAEGSLFHHGLTSEFELSARQRLSFLEAGQDESPCSDIRVGFVGNLTRWATDYRQLTKVVQEHPHVHFEFFGPEYYVDKPMDCIEEGERYLNCLRNAPNVTLHGPQVPSVICDAQDRIDAWIACYDAKRDINADADGITNSHKIMEYLSSGKVVVSNLFTMYTEVSDLFAMLPTSANANYSRIFGEVISNLEHYNSVELQKRRIHFALDNTYLRQSERMLERFLG